MCRLNVYIDQSSKIWCMIVSLLYFSSCARSIWVAIWFYTAIKFHKNLFDILSGYKCIGTPTLRKSVPTVFVCMMESAEGESKNGPNWLELPRDVTTNILQKLDVVEILMSARQVCSLWWNICKDPFMWRTIVMTYPRNSPYNLAKICRYAVRQSCGHLEDINIEYFGTNELLIYIANRYT